MRVLGGVVEDVRSGAGQNDGRMQDLDAARVILEQVAEVVADNSDGRGGTSFPHKAAKG